MANFNNKDSGRAKTKLGEEMDVSQKITIVTGIICALMVWLAFAMVAISRTT